MRRLLEERVEVSVEVMELMELWISESSALSFSSVWVCVRDLEVRMSRARSLSFWSSVRRC